MLVENIKFDEFVLTVPEEHKVFITDLHNKLMNEGCRIQIKTAKSGCLVSYKFNKKTLANYVFRESGLIARLYVRNINSYMDFLDSLPETMQTEIKNSSQCKRLIDPESCNSKCSMGYDFLMNGERFQKCKNDAFMFNISADNYSYIEDFLLKEIEYSKK